MPRTGDLCEKDPNSTAWPKGIDWTDYCAARSTTIASSAWSVRGADQTLTIDTDSIVTGNLMTQVKLSGGSVGEVYRVTNRITTAAGAVDDRSILVLVKDL